VGNDVLLNYMCVHEHDGRAKRLKATPSIYIHNLACVRTAPSPADWMPMLSAAAGGEKTAAQTRMPTTTVSRRQELPRSILRGARFSRTKSLRSHRARTRSLGLSLTRATRPGGFGEESRGGTACRRPCQDEII